jgi:hypothetical protein
MIPPVPPQYEPPTQAPPYGAEPVKYRPKARWFVIGAGLVLAAIGLFAAAMVAILGPLFHEDAVFPASEPHTVNVPAHSQRALYSDGDSGLTCSAVDGTGAALPLRLVTGHFTVNQWTAVFRFDTGDGEVTLDCGLTGDSSQVRVGELPSTGTFVVGLVVGILGPLVLGLAGGLILVITFIRYLTRQRRPGAPEPPLGTIAY